MSEAQWRITFPIEKAVQRDGGYHLVGLASGPEIDAQGERMSPQVIYRFADQINAGGGLPLADRLVYRDAHADDGVMRDLGWVNKAWVNEHGQLAVDVLLDDENPAAMYLYKQIERGKKFGMSVAGRVLEAAEEFVADIGRKVQTFKSVILTEISNTTRPAWTPSFGSVLAKALKDDLKDIQDWPVEDLTGESDDEALADSSEGDDQIMSDTDLDQSGTAEDQVDTDTDAGEADADAQKSDETQVDDVEKAGRKFSADTRADMLALYESFGSKLKDWGVIDADTTDTDSESSTDKADDAEDTAETQKTDDEPTDELSVLKAAIEELRASDAAKTAKIEELEKRQPTQLPPVIHGETGMADFEKSWNSLDPSAKLRVSLAALHDGK